VFANPSSCQSFWQVDTADLIMVKADSIFCCTQTSLKAVWHLAVLLHTDQSTLQLEGEVEPVDLHSVKK
jgi:hypothetical protein